jgi:hypothetical protein
MLQKSLLLPYQLREQLLSMQHRVINRTLGDIHRDPARLIPRELYGALRDGVLRARGAIG